MSITVACKCGGRKVDGTCNRCGAGPRPKDHRESAYRRGYDKRWQRLSDTVAQEQPLCACCLLDGIVRPGVDRHHIVPIEQDESKRLDRDNIINVCRACHKHADELRVRQPAKYRELMGRAVEAAACTPGGVFF